MNKLNYEEWIVAYLDGELNHDEVLAFNNFFEDNPDLKSEISAFEKVKLVPDETLLYDDKEALSKKSRQPNTLKKIWPIVVAGLIVVLGFLLLKGKTDEPNATESSKLFHIDNLEKQTFTIDNSKEQSLITKNGSIILVPKNAFTSKKKKVKVYVQEALSSEEILMANLITQNKNGALSSGGMINFNVAEGENASLQKAVEIFIPRKSYNPKMSIYKGAKDSIGTISWENPKPVLGKKKSVAYLQGETIYKQDCQSCHSVFEDKTGPALYNVQERRPKEWLHKFIKNSSKMIADNDPYAVCIYNEYNKTAQPVFTNLSSKEIDDILFYIKEQSDTRPDLADQFPSQNSCDSCETYKHRMQEIYEARPAEIAKLNKNYSAKLKDEYQTFGREEKVFLPNPVYPTTVRAQNSKPAVIYNEPPPKDYFYPIQANTLGWYNIDILMKLISNNPCDILVTIASVAIKQQVSLLIPALKANLNGISKGTGNYAFGINNNQVVNIPPNEQCFIISVGDKGDTRSLAIESFKSGKEHRISLTPKEMSKTEIESKIKDLKLDQYEISTYAPTQLKRDRKQQKINEAKRKKREEEELAIRKKREAEYAKLKQKHKNNLNMLSTAWIKEQQNIEEKYHQEILEAALMKPKDCYCELLVEEGEALRAATTFAPRPSPANTSRGLGLDSVSQTEINKVIRSGVDKVNKSSGATQEDYE